MMKAKVVIVLLIPTFLSAYVEKAHLNDDWYPQEPYALQIKINEFDAQAQQQYNAAVTPKTVKALIVPHASFEYSGAVAAAAYRLADPTTKRVIILATDHHNKVLASQVALPYFDDLILPSGKISVDRLATNMLMSNNLFQRNQLAFRQEHSVEIQLPFIAHYFPKAKIVPLIVGQINCAQAESIAKTVQTIIDDTTLVVVSSDFVHYGSGHNFTPFVDYVPLRIRDLNSQAIELLGQKKCAPFEQFMEHHEPRPTICGGYPLKVLMALTQSKKFGSTEPRLVAYQTSPGLVDNQVSYVGMLFTAEKLAQLPIEQQLTQQEQHNLYQYAKATMKNLFLHPVPESIDHPILSHGLIQKYGLFITLRTIKDALRGCTGVISSNQALWKTAKEFVINTAFKDGRFNPLTQVEPYFTSLEISVLSSLRRIKKLDEIQLGKHGIMIQKNDNRALFLPEVPTESEPNLDLLTTLEKLSIKAGLPQNAWNKGAQLSIFTTLKIDQNIK